MPKVRYFDADVDREDELEDASTNADKRKKGNKRDETYVSIGTPLPEIEDFDAAAKKETRPVIQARVHGQKILPGSDMPRLHGAFTGGFSAGYFNTVGSKEGFVPSVFLSSRQQRAQLKEQKAVDYMDEEDVSAHGIAPREIRAAETFSSMSKSEKDATEAAKLLPSSAIPEFASSFANLVSPAQSNIGIRLLKSMGWRHGQRTGHNFSSTVTKSHNTEAIAMDCAAEKLYGCSLPPGFSVPDSDNSEEEEPPPDQLELSLVDLKPYSYTPKADIHGLGYSGMNAQEDLSESAAVLFARSGKRGIRGQAFGVGFEGEDAEDFDIYTTDSLKNYDFALEDADKEEAKNVFHGWTAPAITAGPSKSADSRIVPGFQPGTRAFFKRQATKLPALPANYKPIRGYVSTSAETAVSQSRSRFDQKQVMTAQLRAAILESGEESKESPNKASVFDYIRPEDKYKLDAAVAASKPADNPEKDEYAQVQDKNISSAPLKQFDPTKPFASDPEKQSRYEAYLMFKQINKDYSDLDLPVGMTEWEQQREREQFDRAARLLQPLSWSIAQRFTRASGATTADDDTTTEVNRDDVADNLTEKKQAVKLKMFGKLTRSVLEWHPAALVCKRFNVKNPYPDSQLVGLPKIRRSKFSIF